MAIIVLGGGIEGKDKIPAHVKLRLDKAFELYLKSKEEKIVLCGKYSFLYPKSNLPIKTEAQLNKEYLIGKGVSARSIFLENRSKDTIGNVYYAKKLYFIPKKEKNIVVITSDFHIGRSKYLFKKIFGDKYNIKYIATPSLLKGKMNKDVFSRQLELLNKTKSILAKMKNGDHNFLKNKLYKIKFYKEQRPNWVKQFVAKGEIK